MDLTRQDKTNEYILCTKYTNKEVLLRLLLFRFDIGMKFFVLDGQQRRFGRSKRQHGTRGTADSTRSVVHTVAKRQAAIPAREIDTSATRNHNERWT